MCDRVNWLTPKKGKQKATDGAKQWNKTKDMSVYSHMMKKKKLKLLLMFEQMLNGAIYESSFLSIWQLLS